MLLQPVILGSQNATSAVNGATTEPRIRINRPDDENARCKGSRAWDPRKGFSQCMQQSTTPSTSNATSSQAERTDLPGLGDADMAQSRRRGVISATRNFPHQISDNVTKPSAAPSDDRAVTGGSVSTSALFRASR
jgi:hypothetical protein